MKKICSKTLALLSTMFLMICFASSCRANKESNSSEVKKETGQNKIIRLSTTTSVNDSGLLPYLQGDFENDTGYKLEITSAGTGAAIEKGKSGDADCLLVHAKASEEEFIESGFGLERNVLMYNFFVIAGPKNDPAKIADCSTANEAFAAIAESSSKFVSRGDDSGTHKAELKIWEAAGIDPTGKEWYLSTGQGMGASLNVASEEQAYILTDKATYLSHELRDTLSVLKGEAADLKNTYSAIAVNPEKWSDTNIDGANAFIKWMKSDKAKEKIESYGVEEYGQQLFYVS